MPLRPSRFWSFDGQTTEQSLALAEHFDEWAERLSDNPALSAKFRQLAMDARASIRDKQHRGAES
jgi:hypothetical protein